MIILIMIRGHTKANLCKPLVKAYNREKVDVFTNITIQIKNITPWYRVQIINDFFKQISETIFVTASKVNTIRHT